MAPRRVLGACHSAFLAKVFKWRSQDIPLVLRVLVDQAVSVFKLLKVTLIRELNDVLHVRILEETHVLPGLPLYRFPLEIE